MSTRIATRADKLEANRQIKGEVYDCLRRGLTKAEKNNKTWVENFITDMLQEAKADPSGALGQMIARQIMQDDILTNLDQATEKLLMRDTDFMEYRILKTMFKNQREVFLDTMIRHKVLMTSRRAGKTETDCRILVGTCVKPNSPCVYINLKFENAIKQAFDICVDIANRIELTITKKSKSDGFIEFQNGSSILFKGNHDRADAQNLRGFHFRLAIVDEAQSQCNMNELVDDVLEPCLMDFTDSMIILSGTPPRVPHTYFQRAYHSNGWTPYHWTMAENPFIKDSEAEIERKCHEKGITKDDSLIQREYYGLESFDTEAQVFKGYRTYTTIPDTFKPTHIITGCDWGYNDYNSFITLAYDVKTKEGYVIKECKFNKAPVSDILNKAIEQFHWSKAWFISHNHSALLENCTMVCDTNEKAMIYELQKTYKIPATGAYKYDKANAMATLADVLRTKISVPKGGILEDEFLQTVYKRDEETDDVTNEIDDSIFHPDACDALLYASRHYVTDCGVDEIEKKPLKTSDYIKDSTGTIIRVADDEQEPFIDGGIIG